MKDQNGKQKRVRGSYNVKYRSQESNEIDGNFDTHKLKKVKFNGYPYVFKRVDFITEMEDDQYEFRD